MDATAAAEAAGVSVATVRRWVRRAEVGEPLVDRSSAPQRIPHRTPLRLVKAIEALRRLRMTGAQIAEVLGLALSTVSVWLKRIGLGKRSGSSRPSRPTATSAATRASCPCRHQAAWADLCARRRPPRGRPPRKPGLPREQAKQRCRRRASNTST